MADNRSEKATARRKQKAREKGQVGAFAETLSARWWLLAVHFRADVAAADVGGPVARLARTVALRSGSSAETSGWGTPVFSWTALTVAQWIAPVLVRSSGRCVAFAYGTGRVRVFSRSAVAELESS